MKTERMAARAREALRPTWPQVRTFTEDEVRQSRAAQDRFYRCDGDDAGVIAEWIGDLQRRSGAVSLLHVQVDYPGGLVVAPYEEPPLSAVTLTVTPKEQT